MFRSTSKIQAITTLLVRGRVDAAIARPGFCPGYGDMQMLDSSSIRVRQHAANAQKNTTDPVAWANVKPKANRTRTLAFSAFLYEECNFVERFFNKLNHFRAVPTRYDKLAENYLAGVKLASAGIWMRHNELPSIAAASVGAILRRRRATAHGIGCRGRIKFCR